MADDVGPGFGYSIGFYKTFNHPEIIIVGLKLDLIHTLINNIGHDIQNGKVFKSGNFHADIIDGFDCKMLKVSKQFYDLYVGQALWFYENDDFPLLQCIYPTIKGIYPWESNWPEEIKDIQPVLTNF